ncbi:MAG TPA: tetratricopeptide repeat protein [Polyangiaceae bacterium]
MSDAKDLFTRARELRAHGDCAGAVPLFRKAVALYPDGLGSVRNLAECEESLGHYASARRAWLDLKRALLTDSDKKYDGWQKDADDAAARLAPKLATLTIDVNAVGPSGDAAAPGGVEVKLDGETLSPSLVGTALERDPGRHIVQVGGPRVKEPAQKAVDLAAGDAKRVALRVVVTPDKPVEPEVGAPLPATPAIAPDDSAENARAAKRTAAWIAIGVGAAAAIGAGVSIGIRANDESTLQSKCPLHTGCDPSLEGTVNGGHTASTAATVFTIVGGVGLVSGIVLLATSSGSRKQATLVVTPTLGGATAAWRS